MDGQRVIATGGGKTASVWDVRSGQALAGLQHPAPLQDLAISPDGTRLATGAQDGFARVWDLTSGSTSPLAFDIHNVFINGVSFSPDGRLLATTGNDALVRLWDAQSGRQLVARSGHAGATFGVAFSPDGQYLATSSVDRTVKIWRVVGEALEPEEPLTLTGHAAAVYRVVWSPDGRRLATASRDAASRVYAIAVQDLVAIAHARVTRGLTADECQKYLHAPTCPS